MILRSTRLRSTTRRNLTTKIPSRRKSAARENCLSRLPLILTKKKVNRLKSNFVNNKKIDPNEYSEYAMTSFEYFRAREHTQVVQNYMSEQTELSEKMRMILVDWQVEVSRVSVERETNRDAIFRCKKVSSSRMSRSTCPCSSLTSTCPRKMSKGRICSCSEHVRFFLPRNST
jgi:hypothetical protein